MAYTKEQKTFLSKDDTTEIVYYVYTPDKTPKGIFHIIHGMCEYMERYENLAEFLCKNGIVVCGCDQRGHGKSAKTEEDLGFFGQKKGYTFFSKDNESLRLIMREKYKRLPYIMLGHSMGSLILRDYILDYGENIDGAILSGLVREDLPLKQLIRMSEWQAVLKGGKGRSIKLKEAFMKKFDLEFPEKTKGAWLSRDALVGEENAKDSLCNFDFTSRGYNDLARLANEVCYVGWAYDILKSLPIMLMSGSDDPIGNRGKAIDDLFVRLEDAEVNNISMKLYEGARHELVHETNKEEIFADILEWTDSVIEGVVACMTM